MKLSSLFSLENQYHFYRQYHTNKSNVRIHFVFVPVLLITAMVALSELSGSLLDLGAALAVFYIVHGLILDVPVGAAHTPVVLGYLLASRTFRNMVGPANSLGLALSLHVVSWVIQFVGHAVFEKRAPAITDSLAQALTSAPIVLWLEILFSLGLFSETKTRLARSKVVAKARKAQKQASASKQ